MDKQESCLVQKSGHIMTITMNRPESYNALRPVDCEAMEKAFDDFQKDPEMWVAILTGEGPKAFCTGDDLKYLAAGGKLTTPPSGFGGITSRFDLTKPVIAAVNGFAMGGGMEIALACDLIIASENAIFALPEVHVGLAALGGGMRRLPRQIGIKRALGILLTGRKVKAEEAMDLGFVNEVVAQEMLMSTVLSLANDIVNNAPLSVRATKQCAMEGLNYASVEEAMNATYSELPVMLESDDAKEGPKAFAEKRAPKWVGH